jgi:hypothetical protein
VAEAESRGQQAKALKQQLASKQETIMAVAKETVVVMTMATENATPPQSRDLVTTTLVFAAEALATLKAATAAAVVLAAEAVALVLAAEALALLKAATATARVFAAEAAALVLAAEAAATLKTDDNNGGNGGIAIVSSTSLAVGGGVINYSIFICC